MITTYQYGRPRTDSSLRIGVARKPPRGVRKEDWAKKGFFDLWLKILSPSEELVHRYRQKKISFSRFAASYRSEMKQVEPQQVITLLALLARERPISLGCFCKDEDQCHRSVLKRLLEAADTKLSLPERYSNSSPVCFLNDHE